MIYKYYVIYTCLLIFVTSNVNVYCKQLVIHTILILKCTNISLPSAVMLTGLTVYMFELACFLSVVAIHAVCLGTSALSLLSSRRHSCSLSLFSLRPIYLNYCKMSC